jgi:hypothetical protein
MAGEQLRDTTQDVLDTLIAANDPPQVFRWGGKLARVRLDEDAGPWVEPYDVNTMPERFGEPP